MSSGLGVPAALFLLDFSLIQHHRKQLLSVVCVCVCVCVGGGGGVGRGHTLPLPLPPPPFLPPLGMMKENNLTFYTPPHNSGGVLWFHVGRPRVHPSVVRPSVFRFQMIT